MTDTITVEIPANVKDNSPRTVRVQWRSSVADELTEQDLRLAREVFGYTVYVWDDVDRDGNRVTLTRMDKADGRNVWMYETSYFTRVACHMGEWCPSYATYYVRQDDPREPVEEAQPYCDTHTAEIIGQPLNLREHSYITEDGDLILLSERLRIGQHD